MEITEGMQLKYAALLHDFGKFQQRSMLGPKQKHETLTWNIINTHIPPALGDSIAWMFSDEEVAADERHADLKTLVEMGDWLSASERKLRAKSSKEETALINIFSLVAEEPSEKTYLPVAKLSPELQFPSENKNANYSKELVKEFYGELDRIRPLFDEDERAYFNTLLTTMERFFSFVPSSYYYDEPYISLYTHSKISAAITLALYHEIGGDPKKISELGTALKDLFKKSKELQGMNRNATKDELALLPHAALKKEYFTLVKGDLSGIQDFIFSLPASWHALKFMRGKSLFIKLFNQISPEWIARNIGLPKTNVIYASGGNFYLLIPISKFGALRETVDNINLALFKLFGTSLYLSVSSTNLAPLEFHRLYAGEKWGELSAKNGDKLSKYARLLDETQLLKSRLPTGELCEACGMEGAVEVEDGHYLCPSCQAILQLSDIGRRSVSGGKLELGCGLFGTIFGKSFPKVFSVNSIEYPYVLLPKHLPMDKDGSPLTTDKMASASGKSFGEKYGHPCLGGDCTSNLVGILKMDVDSLGKIFREGLNVDYRTFSSMYQLSRSISLFFEMYIGEIIQNNSLFSKTIYVIYAGGDDLLVFGSWDSIVLLAEEIREKFREYTQNPRITISAGISLAGGKFPARRSVEIAEEYLEKSKSWRPLNAKGERPKDSITLFDRSMVFSDFKEVIDGGDYLSIGRLLGFIIENGTPGGRGFIHLLINTLERNRPDKHITVPELWKLEHTINTKFKKKGRKERAEDLLRGVSETVWAHLAGGEDGESKFNSVLVGLRISELATKGKEGED